jgi:hypothetical protein
MYMKKCTKCGCEKEFLLFAKRAKSKDGFASWCKECFAKNAANKYKSSEEERIRKNKNKSNTQNKARDFIWEYLKIQSCIDCGNNNPKVLEFDHKDESQKSFNISEMFGLSVDRIKKEIEKCEVRCANCHRIKTQSQFESWRSFR